MGISNKKVMKCIMESLKHRDEVIDSNDLDNLVDFMHKHTHKEVFKSRTSDNVSRFKELILKGDESATQSKSVTCVDEFATLCTQECKLPFGTIKELFKPDRRRNLGERLFTPADLDTILSHKTVGKECDTPSRNFEQFEVEGAAGCNNAFAIDKANEGEIASLEKRLALAEDQLGRMKECWQQMEVRAAR